MRGGTWSGGLTVKRDVAELVGTFVLVVGGCGSAEVILLTIARQPYLPNTCFRRSVARAVGFVRIFCSSCPNT